MSMCFPTVMSKRENDEDPVRISLGESSIGEVAVCGSVCGKLTTKF